MAYGQSDWAQHSHTGYGQPPPTSYRHLPQPVYRSQLDAAQSAAVAPDAQYPYGYLGDVHSRREDRLLKALKRRANARDYTRGVHAGSRAVPESYFWPVEMDPMNGLKAIAAGVKQRPLMEFSPEGRTLVNDGKFLPRGADSLYSDDPVALARFRPSWR